ncbi:hypothetical protein FOI68_22600 [Brevibacillus sp. LEMMJ03]|uniref:DUF6979 family protein n=1 Tax=Brevibacillus sp. LEMMJ03 TaxID=2595056 RepID=UPI00117F73F6|nr:hypothetical protein [Brevibacillus sp. LEMMJ03]TRY22277.1 hypothetical protein FOI68_22600 [Brevibacillus sp. LEMMJ03]
MGKYGQAAVKAVYLINSKQTMSPLEAWNHATSEIFGEGTHGQKKGCPRNAFLGLCEEGLVRSVSPGKYTKSEDNKAYALQGLTLLKQNPSLAESPSALWKATGIKKSHNNQMDVVISLWKSDLLEK